MTRDLKVGGVYMVARTDGTTTIGMWGGYSWQCPSPASGSPIDLSVPPRPLLVIDPANRDQVERLRNACITAGTGSSSVDDFMVALRGYFPPRAEVYEHLVTSERHDDRGTVVTGLCGKVWRVVSRSEVTVLGRCPDCDEMAKAGWVA